MVNRFRGLPSVAKIALVAVAGVMLTGCCLCAFVSSQSNKASPSAVTPAPTSPVKQLSLTLAPDATTTRAETSTPTLAPSVTATRPGTLVSPTLAQPTNPPTIAATATPMQSPKPKPTNTPAPTVAPAALPTTKPTNTTAPIAPTAVPPTVAPVASGYVCLGGERCIKGNINDGRKLYHLPECPSYKSTKIDESKGERWFATAAEAEAAGWRKAQNCP